MDVVDEIAENNACAFACFQDLLDTHSVVVVADDLAVTRQFQ